MKIATTIEEQIEKLKSRGMIFEDEEKAKEILLDIGYFRLGSYCFPFEKTFPKLKCRDHEYVEGTCFQDVINLYYFDNDLRQILAKVLNRIEINFRTFLTYTVSNHYSHNPIWFVSPEVVFPPSKKEIMKLRLNKRTDNQPIEEKAFEQTIYKVLKADNQTIQAHHRKYPNDKFAPAWKTLEFMTLGGICYLYLHLKSQKLTQEIAYHYGSGNKKKFSSYLHTIRILRNTCAHGGRIYDIKLVHPILSGPAKIFVNSDASNANAAIQVIRHILGKISFNRKKDFDNDINNLLAVKRSPRVAQIIAECTGIEERNDTSNNI